MSQTTGVVDLSMSGANGTSAGSDMNVIGKLVPALIEVRFRISAQLASPLFDPGCSLI